MKKFVIVSLTDKGSKDILRCLREGEEEIRKMSRLDRVKFNKVWVRDTKYSGDKIISDSWEINKDAVRLVKIDILDCVKEVKKAMNLNGSKFGIDFRIEVINNDE